MKEYAVDLHVHIGSSLQGEPVKITASPRLTLTAIIKGEMQKKGLDMVGVIDAASPRVLDDLEYLLSRGDLLELEEGGFMTPDKRVLLGGSEVEIKEREGVAHFLSFFPFMKNLKAFSRELSKSMKNVNLSSQRTSYTVEEMYQLTHQEEGFFIPAHAFTPFKSIYGSCSSSLEDLLPLFSKKIQGLELGLSADTFIASHLQELEEITFLSNSDAHSLEKMGREFNLITMKELSFNQLTKALQQEEGMGIKANYGLDPRLGKYHRSYCNHCSVPLSSPPPISHCPQGEEHQVVMGVLDRAKELGELKGMSLDSRPPYYYQIPLEFIPGLGEKGREKLYHSFGNEREILHSIEEKELKEVVGPLLTEKILRARRGEWLLESGGGGTYGRLLKGT